MKGLGLEFGSSGMLCLVEKEMFFENVNMSKENSGLKLRISFKNAFLTFANFKHKTTDWYLTCKISLNKEKIMLIYTLNV